MGHRRHGPPSDDDPEEPLTDEGASEALDDSGDDQGAGRSAGVKDDKFERYRTRHKLLWVALSGTVAVLDGVVAVMQCVLSLGMPASLYGTAAAFNGLAALYIGAAALAIQFGGGSTHFDMGIALLPVWSATLGNIAYAIGAMGGTGSIARTIFFIVLVAAQLMGIGLVFLSMRYHVLRLYGWLKEKHHKHRLHWHRNHRH
ncbi:uncharacterized protein JCM10292_003049 [Rhodotorula paludigena]|uniref:uncharacterized protein n=1 Tax=Rhodotorula paludigena TaxID=86838 RepID=UPI0031727D74